MKKLLTFGFMIAICFFATPVFAKDYYKGSCSCSLDSGMIVPGVCDRDIGCTCPGQIYENTCVKTKTNNTTNNNSSNTSNKIDLGNSSSSVDCGVIADITRPAVRLILIISPIILIIMGTVDILGVVTSGDEKGMRKAWSNLVKRFVICVVIFLLPLLVNFVIGWTTFKDLTACM